MPAMYSHGEVPRRRLEGVHQSAKEEGAQLLLCVAPGEQPLPPAVCCSVLGVHGAPRSPGALCRYASVRATCYASLRCFNAGQRHKPAGDGCAMTASQSCTAGPALSTACSAAKTSAFGTARVRAASFRVATAPAVLVAWQRGWCCQRRFSQTLEGHCSSAQSNAPVCLQRPRNSEQQYAGKPLEPARMLRGRQQGELRVPLHN